MGRLKLFFTEQAYDLDKRQSHPSSRKRVEGTKHKVISNSNYTLRYTSLRNGILRSMIAFCLLCAMTTAMDQTQAPGYPQMETMDNTESPHSDGSPEQDKEFKLTTNKDDFKNFEFGATSTETIRYNPTPKVDSDSAAEEYHYQIDDDHFKIEKVTVDKTHNRILLENKGESRWGGMADRYIYYLEQDGQNFITHLRERKENGCLLYNNVQDVDFTRGEYSANQQKKKGKIGFRLKLQKDGGSLNANTIEEMNVVVERTTCTTGETKLNMTIHKRITSDLFEIGKVSGITRDDDGKPRIQLIPRNQKTGSSLSTRGVRRRFLYFFDDACVDEEPTCVEKEGRVFIQFLLNERVEFETDLGPTFLATVGLKKCEDQACDRPYHIEGKKVCSHTRRRMTDEEFEAHHRAVMNQVSDEHLYRHW